MSETTDSTTRTPSLGGAAERPKEGEVAEELRPPSPEADAKLDEPEERDEREGLADDAPEELVEAARGRVPEKDDPDGDQAEATVLSYLLGPTMPLEYDVEALIDTPTGQQTLTFHFRQLDDTRIEELEAEWTEGDGPFRRVDRKMLNAAKVAAATLWLEDADGNKVEIDSRDFRGPIPSAIDAMRGRFKFQPGILSSVAMEIDAAAGMMQNRVGQAQRSAITSAVKNS